MTDITEHPTSEGTLYLCAVKDAWSNRIVGYSIADRMTSQLALDALESAVARHGGHVAGCTLHSDRGGQFRSKKLQQALWRHHMRGSMGRVGSAGDNAAMESFFSLLQRRRARPPPMGHPRRTPDRDRHLDRTHLPPPTPPEQARLFDPHRIRNQHDHAGRAGRPTTVTVSFSRNG
ncbi:transposase InsO family protein [Prauserella sediminis]|uniref:Transposase InsO family protein n=1 Tax=Prauserella sediminis TaxID=577680 RepID=A0A839XXN1_9PSEU|nr:DDE-type integrase/transposase/recombinase [Prauserella sediminis]MBB3665213.1 transposase InsO family protein [Prauserella sediminis]